MWPFVLHREQLHFPHSPHTVRGRIAAWLHASAEAVEPWTGVVNVDHAELEPARRYASGVPIANIRMTLRYDAEGSGGDERTSMQVVATNAPDQALLLVAMVVILAAAGSGWWAAVREGRVPFDWRAVGVLGAFVVGLLALQWSLARQARATVRQLVRAWALPTSPVPSAGGDPSARASRLTVR